MKHLNWWWIFRVTVTCGFLVLLSFAWHPITTVGWFFAYLGIGLGVAAVCDLARWSYRQRT